MRVKLLALVLVLGLMLVACGSDADDGDEADADDTGTDTDDDDDDDDDTADADPDPDPVELSFWLFGGFGLEPIVEEYMELNPHVTITMQQTNFGEHHNALTTTLAAGSGAPDIAAVEVGHIGRLVNQAEAFHNLYDYGAADIEDRYLEWKWRQAQTLDGQTVIGVPTDVAGMGICYRVDLFEEAGLPSDRDEVSAMWADSWDGFIQAGIDYRAATGRAFTDGTEPIWNAVVNQAPATYYDDDGTLIVEDSAQVISSWEIVTRMIDADLIADVGAFSPEWEAGMSDGTFAAITCPAWMTGNIEGAAPETAGNWDIATVPGGGGNWGGSHLVVPAQSEHPQEAFDFLAWAQAPEQQLKVFVENGNFPSIPALYDTDEVQSLTNPFFNDAPVGQIFADNAYDVVAQNTGPDYSVIHTEFLDGLSRLIQGVESADEAYESILDNVRRELNL